MESSLMMSSVDLDEGVHWWCPLWTWMEEFIDDVSCGPGWRVSLTIPVGLDRGIHWYCLLWAWMEEFIDDISVGLDGVAHWWHLWVWMEQLIDHSCAPRWRSSLMIPLGLDGGAHWWCLCGSRRRSSLMMSSVTYMEEWWSLGLMFPTSHPPFSFLHRAYFLSPPLAFL